MDKKKLEKVSNLLTRQNYLKERLNKLNKLLSSYINKPFNHTFNLYVQPQEVEKDLRPVGFGHFHGQTIPFYDQHEFVRFMNEAKSADGGFYIENTEFYHEVSNDKTDIIDLDDVEVTMITDIIILLIEKYTNELNIIERKIKRL